MTIVVVMVVVVVVVSPSLARILDSFGIFVNAAVANFILVRVVVVGRIASCAGTISA